jgi:hypothetical protein
MTPWKPPDLMGSHMSWRDQQAELGGLSDEFWPDASKTQLGFTGNQCSGLIW